VIIRASGKALAAALTAAMLIAITACTTASGGSNNSSGHSGSSKDNATLTVSVGGDPLEIDPALIESGLGTQVDMLMAQTLTTYFYTGKLTGLLATSWKSNTSGSAWTFNLRHGVKFTDGTPFNAVAVQKNIERLLDPKLAVVTSNDVGRFTKSVTVDSPYQVTFNLTQPVRYFPEALSNETAAITSPASWTAPGNTYTNASHVVGTGPYKLVKWVKNNEVVFTRNDSYWGKEPYYKTQIYQAITDSNARETSLRAGQIQVATGLPAADVASLKSDSSLKVSVSFGTRINYIALNTTSTVNPALQNPLVREALNYAVDKNAIVKNILFGAGQVSTSPVVNGAFGWCQTGPYPYDPAKARELLKQAGESHMSLTLITPNGRFLQDSQTTEAVAGYLRAVGVKVNGPLVQDNATNLDLVILPPSSGDSNPQAEAYLWSFGADFPDAAEGLGNLFLSTSIPPKPGLNFTHYANAQVDKLTLGADAALNPTVAEQKYCQAEKIVWNAAPDIFLYTAGLIVAWSSSVDGITTAPNSLVNTVYADPAS
jgi:peptide/nickel transport system substrate-binding protein